MLAVAKITAKGQTTIPQDIRAALHVALGDLIAWEVGADVLPALAAGWRCNASRGARSGG